MTTQQREMIDRLEGELKKRGHIARLDWTESNCRESRGFLFGLVKGVTVTISPQGLVNIPAVRTYHPPRYLTPVLAAAEADELWAKQKTRDDANLDNAKKRRTGHLSPIVDPDLRCKNTLCPCHCESEEELRRRERGGFNNRFQCL